VVAWREYILDENSLHPKDQDYSLCKRSILQEYGIEALKAGKLATGLPGS
jgi:hypothetical protein